MFNVKQFLMATKKFDGIPTKPPENNFSVAGAAKSGRVDKALRLGQQILLHLLNVQASLYERTSVFPQEGDEPVNFSKTSPLEPFLAHVFVGDAITATCTTKATLVPGMSTVRQIRTGVTIRNNRTQYFVLLCTVLTSAQINAKDILQKNRTPLHKTAAEKKQRNGITGIGSYASICPLSSPHLKLGNCPQSC